MVFSLSHYIKKIKCYFEKLGTFSQKATKPCKCNELFIQNTRKKPNIEAIIGNHDRNAGISDSPYRAFAYSADKQP